ncbi:MAG: hypothetical protein IT379_27245 [Deltaproteobacteria bacterium]|nr:hypothetical protein [Deltaproteobacteria bacterium]
MGSTRVGYPLAELVLGGDASPLWRLSAHDLSGLTAGDATTLAERIARLEAATHGARDAAALLGVDRLDGLDAARRTRIRHVWWRYLDALLALDALKQRYRGWYGVDYFRLAPLHARTFVLAFAPLCAELATGAELLEIVAGRDIAQRLFDEAMPDVGLRAGTFSELRATIARARDHSWLALGTAWYDQWIQDHLQVDEVGRALATLATQWRDRAFTRVGTSSAGASLLNKLEVVRDAALSAWFPIQKGAAEWLGDTRVVAEGRRLVSDAQIGTCAALLRPGDVLLARRNWYLSNVGLPGFWPHAALHVGTLEDLATLGREPDVFRAYGDYVDHLRAAHPRAVESLAGRDEHGHARRVLEAVSEGVIASSVEHACGADYVAALRPRTSALAVARAIDRGLGYFGRPYDFQFDFGTDDAVVCSELVMKAYEAEGPADCGGLRVPFVEVAGKSVQPPTEIVRVFARELGRDDAQLDFVFFFDGREASADAVMADARALAASAERPKWDFMLP